MEVNPNFDNQAYYQTNDAFASDSAGKSRGIAALLAIFLGCFGVQYFYLGKTTPAIVCLLVSILSCFFLSWIPGILGLIQGIKMFIGDNKSFDEKFVLTDNKFPIL